MALGAGSPALSRNLRRSAAASITVYDSNQRWGNSDRGLQLFGTAREVAGPAARDAEHTYAARFPWYERAEVGAYRFYRFRPRRVKLLDEEALGAGVFVTASVHAGQIAWQQTEIYDRGS